MVETQAGPLPLAPSLKLVNHSPTGFAWGYGGSGPSQLALAILLDSLGDDNLALTYYQDFKWSFIANAPREGFTISEEEIRDWLMSRGPIAEEEGEGS